MSEPIPDPVEQPQTEYRIVFEASGTVAQGTTTSEEEES